VPVPHPGRTTTTAVKVITHRATTFWARSTRANLLERHAGAAVVGQAVAPGPRRGRVGSSLCSAGDPRDHPPRSVRRSPDANTASGRHNDGLPSGDRATVRICEPVEVAEPCAVVVDEAGSGRWSYGSPVSIAVGWSACGELAHRVSVACSCSSPCSSCCHREGPMPCVTPLSPG